MSNISAPVIDNNDWRKSQAFAKMPADIAYSALCTFEEYDEEVRTKARKTALQVEKAATKATAAMKASNTLFYLAMTKTAIDNAYTTLIASPLDKSTADRLMKEKEIAAYVARNANITAAKARAIAASTADAATLSVAKAEVAQKDLLEINHILNLHMELMGY
jgi:hypothetical protein